MVIQLGTHIHTMLRKSDDLKALVADRVYPLVAPEGSPSFPLVIFGNAGFVSDDTKDGVAADKPVGQIIIQAKSYTEALKVAEATDKALVGRRADYGSWSVSDCWLSGYAEVYDMDLPVYEITLSYTFLTT